MAKKIGNYRVAGVQVARVVKDVQDVAAAL